jgi:hypothetical protein
VIGPKRPYGAGRQSVSAGEAEAANTPANERAAILQRLREATEADGDCWLFVSADRTRRTWRGPPKRNNRHAEIRIFGANLMAHRVAYLLSTGLVIPEGLVVRHKCDRPRCCNPTHLETGTQAENLEDAYVRGRRSRAATPMPVYGRRGGVIPVEAIPVIVARRRAGETHSSIARDFGVTPQGVAKLLKREAVRTG